MNISITDLETNKVLDQEALSNISGGHRRHNYRRLLNRNRNHAQKKVDNNLPVTSAQFLSVVGF